MAGTIRKITSAAALIITVIAVLIASSGLFTHTFAADSPGRVSDLSIRVTSRPLAELTWDRQDCDGYRIYRNSRAIARVGAALADDRVSYVDDSIDPDGSYRYYVRSFNIVDGREIYGSSSPVAEIVDGYTYEAAGSGGISLTGFTGHDQKLIIPDEIGGNTVTAIGDGCFSGNAWLQRVTVPEGVVRIGDYSFECCSLMQKVFLPDSLETIGDGAFSGCGSLTLADLNEGITSIGDGAFMACLNLKQIGIPASLKSMGKFAFALCSSLSYVEFSDDATGLTEIPERAFHGCMVLKELRLPSSVTAIGKRAFFGCTDLSSVSKIDKDLVLSEIGDYAFEGTQINDIYHSLSCGSTLGFGVFARNEIDRFEAFYDEEEDRYQSCFDMEEHPSFPDTVILSEGTFYGSPISGVNLYSDNDPGNYKLIDGSVYTSDGKTLLVYFPTKLNEDYQFVRTDAALTGECYVPEGVERIASYAFFNCGLSKIHLPSTVTEIADNAFTRSGIDRTRLVDNTGAPVDLSGISVSDKAFDKWSLTNERETDPVPSESSDGSFEPASHGPFPGTYSVTSLAGDKNLYRDEDFAGYTDVSAGFDEWCLSYIEANSDIMPMNTNLKTVAPYCHLYKSDAHYNQMATVLNGDPEWVQEALSIAGYEYEEMYRMVDHGLFAELNRGRICGDLLLYSGVTKACTEAIAGVEPGTPVSAEDLVNAIGTEYTEKAMMSTSASSHVSYYFSEDSGVILYILASQDAMDSLGTFCVDSFMGAQGMGGEHEILFNAGARFKVLDVGTSEYAGKSGTRTYVMMQLLEDEKGPSEPLDEMIDLDEAEAEVSEAMKAVESLPEDADAAQIKEAYEKLVRAQQALADALKEYSKVEASLSEEEKAVLKDRISALEKKIDSLTRALAQATVIDISNYASTLEKESYEYTGKAIRPAIRVSGLSSGDYTVSYSNNTKIGTARVVIKARGGSYKGTIIRTFKITKKTNPLSAKGKTAKIRYRKLKRRKQTIPVSKVLKITKKGHGRISYKLASAKKGRRSFKKQFKVNTRTGRITVKKGLKKGTYKLKIKIRAGGNAVFKASPVRTVTLKVRIK